MKKLLFSLLALPVLAVAAPLEEIGFEKAEGYQTGSLENQNTNWRSKGAYPFIVVESDGTTEGQFLESATGEAGEGSRAWITSLQIPPDGEKFIVELDLRAVSSGSPGYQGNLHIGSFPAAPGVHQKGMAAVISLRGSGKIYTWDGETETELGTWKNEMWHNIRLEIDPGTKTFGVTIDGKQLATGLAFADPNTFDITSLGLTHYTSSELRTPSSLAIDNIRVLAE